MKDATHKVSLVVVLVWVLSAAPASADDSKLDLSGTWAHVSVMTAVSKVPLVGQVTTQTKTYGLVEIEQSGRRLEVTTRVCHLAVESGSNALDMVIPSAFVDSLPVVQRQGRIVERNGEPWMNLPRSFSVRGARLTRPRSEALPSRADDPRVEDADGDGKPGLTVEVTGMINGSVYVVQRAWDRHFGKIISKDRIAGRVDWNQQQEVLGATSVFLANSPPTHPHPDPDESHFVMQRIADGAGCATVLEWGKKG